MILDAGLASVIVATIAAAASTISAHLTHKQSKAVAETHTQVTVNHHSSPKPTVLDLIGDVKEAVLELGQGLNDMRSDFNSHVTHSNEMDQRLMQLEVLRASAGDVAPRRVEGLILGPE